MLDRAKMIGGFKNGEYSACTGETYYGGSPASIDTDGYLHTCLVDSGATKFVGVFANSNLVDWGSSSTGAVQLATVYTLPFACILTSGTKDGYADGLPYNDGLTYTEGDPLYVGSDGKWTNVDPGSGIQRGVVMASASGSLTVWFNR